MTAQNGVNTALTRPGRVFPRPFTHGGSSVGGQSVNGGTWTLWGGPTFDRLYHKLKVLLMLSCNYTMQLHDEFIGYHSIKTR